MLTRIAKSALLAAVLFASSFHGARADTWYGAPWTLPPGITGYVTSMGGIHVYYDRQTAIDDAMYQQRIGTCGGGCTIYSVEWQPATIHHNSQWFYRVYSPFWNLVFDGFTLVPLSPDPIVEEPRPDGTPYPFNPNKNQGPPCCSDGPPLVAGNPINVGTGNKFQVETDIGSRGLLGFTRYYNSAPYATTHLSGLQWTTSYSRSVTVNGSTATVLRPGGNRLEFTLVSGVWTPDPDVTLKLQPVSGGWTLRQDDREVESYNSTGQLTRIDRSNGESIVLTYSTGLPTSVTAQDGRTITISYNSSNRIASIVDADGSTFVYGYDTSGHLISVTYPGSTSRTYVYGEAAYTSGATLPNALTGIVDEKNQRFATFAYASDGRAISTEHAGGAEKYQVAYNSDGTAAVTTPGGATQIRTFLTRNGARKASAQGESGSGQSRSTSATFDSNGRVDVYTDALQVTTDLDYNSRGLLTQRMDAANQSAVKRTTQTDWDASFDVPTERRLFNAGGMLETKSTWTYNTRGQPLTITQVNLADATLSRTSSYTYCESAGVAAGTCPLVGLLLAVEGPRSDVSDITTYTYRQTDESSCASSPTTCSYRRGDLWKLSNSLGQTTEVLKRDGAGRVLSVKDENGIITDLEYNARGWTTASKVRGSDSNSEADDAITLLEYDATGAITKATQPDGAFSTFTYDAAHRLTDVGDALGNNIHYTLNSNGNRVQEDTRNSSSAVKRTLSRVYDALGQLETLADAQSTPTDFSYDANGNLDTSTDALGRVTDNSSDALGRLSQVISNSGGGTSDRATTQFQYDASDNPSTVVDPKGLSTIYSYDSLGNLTRRSSPDTGDTLYGYDLAGNRTSEQKADGVTQGYAFDALGRLVVQTFVHSAQNIEFTYDVTQSDCYVGETFSVGRLTKIANDSGSTRYCYDSHGNRVRQVQTTTVGSGSTLATGMTYDGAGRLVAMTYPSGAVVAFVRNANGQIRQVDAQPSAGATQVALVSNATYLPFGPLNVLTFGNGRVLTKSYDQNYRIDSVSDSATTDRLSEDFSTDAVGNITAVSEQTAVATTVPRTYVYDGLGRITAVKNANGGVLETFSYDATGNRLSNGSTAYSYSATDHRLSAVGSTGRAYNATGETLTVGAGTTGVKTYTYDDRHRLSAAYLGNPQTLKLRYYYDGLGQRVATQVNNTQSIVRFVYDQAGHLIGEYTNLGVRIKEYVWMDDTLVAVLSDHDGSTYQFVETDHLGTPRAIIHPIEGGIVWRWNIAPTAFGSHNAPVDVDGDSINYKFNLRFPGQYADSETGLNYNYFRDYDPTTGRYVESDPLGIAGGVSTYGYVQQNPVNFFDPLGLFKSRVNPAVVQHDFADGSMDRVFPGARPPEPADATNEARTTFDWEINSPCICDSAGNYHLQEYSITITPRVHLRAGYSSPQKSSFVRNGEFQHVGNIRTWGKSLKRAGREIEQVQQGKSFADLTACEEAARAEVESWLQGGAQSTVDASVKKYDASGRHTWRGE